MTSRYFAELAAEVKREFPSATIKVVGSGTHAFDVEVRSEAAGGECCSLWFFHDGRPEDGCGFSFGSISMDGEAIQSRDLSSYLFAVLSGRYRHYEVPARLCLKAKTVTSLYDETRKLLLRGVRGGPL